MANPTFEQIFGLDEATVNAGLGYANLPQTTDARTAAAYFLDKLANNYKTLRDAGTDLNAYRIFEDFENVDLTTQRQVFTINLQRNISIGSVQNEPSV